MVPVRDVIITDESTQHPLILSPWNDLAENDCELFNNWSAAFQVVAVPAMRIGTYKEAGNYTNDRQDMINLARDSAQSRTITTKEKVNAKKAANTWQEQKYWIKVTLPEADIQDLYLYIGCNKCGRKSQSNKEVTYTCTHCNHTTAVSVPRVSFTFKAADHTGTKKNTIFTQDVETLIGIPSDQLHNQINSVS
ncbi:Replication protein A 70 kDa DNA-binding subunit B [Bienertia sinuspersici]